MPLTLDHRAPISSPPIYASDSSSPLTLDLPIDQVASVARPAPAHLQFGTDSQCTQESGLELFDAISLPSINLIDSDDLSPSLSQWSDAAPQNMAPCQHAYPQQSGAEMHLDFSSTGESGAQQMSRLMHHSVQEYAQKMVNGMTMTCLGMANQMQQEIQACLMRDFHRKCWQVQGIFCKALQDARMQMQAVAEPECDAPLPKLAVVSGQAAGNSASGWHALQKYFHEDGRLTPHAKSLAAAALNRTLPRGNLTYLISFPLVLAWMQERAELGSNPEVFQKRHRLTGSPEILLRTDGTLGSSGVVLGYIHEKAEFQKLEVKHIVMAFVQIVISPHTFDGTEIFKQYGVNPGELNSCIHVSKSGEFVLSESSLEKITQALDLRGQELVADICNELAGLLAGEQDFMAYAMVLKRMLARTSLSFLYLEFVAMLRDFRPAVRAPGAAASTAAVPADKATAPADKAVSTSRRPRKAAGKRK